MDKAQTIGVNKVITMQYSLANSEGVVVREASEKPVTYLHGAGVLFPKLERELESHCVGDIVTVRLYLQMPLESVTLICYTKYRFLNCPRKTQLKWVATSQAVMKTAMKSFLQSPA